jgi:hypothetical protein
LPDGPDILDRRVEGNIKFKISEANYAGFDIRFAEGFFCLGNGRLLSRAAVGEGFFFRRDRAIESSLLD